MIDEFLRIHSLIPRSHANGPGARAVIWVQGCSLNCPDCFNPETHALKGGRPVPVDDLFDGIRALGDSIEGLTVSGGEPLQQQPALLALLRRVRRDTGLSALVFTGYTWNEVQRMPLGNAFLGLIDILVAGRFDPARLLARDLRGSANNTIHFLTPRYAMNDLTAVPQGEVIIGPDGEVTLTGIDPVTWDR